MGLKTSHLIIVGVGFIIGWNIFLIERDQKMFKAYDKSTSHSNYQYSK